jgi:F-type H+-transporting ATPase subunit h
LVQELYLKEIKAYKPKPLTAKDAEGSVKPWAVPPAPKTPEVEGDVAEVSDYAAAPVEVNVEVATENGDAAAPAAVSDDWFPVEDIKEEAHH